MLGRVGSDYAYPGCELSLFAAAKNWKQYFSHALEPYISGRVAEIGAGLGSTTLVLCQAQHMAWYAVEPDARLLSNLTASVRAGRLPPTVIPVTGSIDALVGEGTFDTILYVDVLEHIEDDRGELLKAAELLRVGGRLIVLSPAYQALYTAFDAQVGHFRRYTLPHLKAVGPAQLKCQAEFYLDSLGVLASVVNRLFLKQAVPTANQVRFWDTFLVPCSKVVDRLIGRSVGRSVVVVWRRES